MSAVLQDPPEWWTDAQMPESMTREQYEREQIASAISSMPDDEPAEDLG